MVDYRVRTPRCSGSRPTLLYRRYSDMRQRARGGSTSCPWVYPPGFPWATYDEFRTWALGAGFSKLNNSPDRPRPWEPYGPTNVVWKPKRDNFATSRGRGYYAEIRARSEVNSGC